MSNAPEQPRPDAGDEPGRVQLSLTDDLRDAIAARFGVRLRGDATAVAGGDECAIWRVGSTVVRIAPPWRVDADLAWTHDLVRHVARSVPEAVAPIVGVDGATFFRFEGHPVSVFPYVDGDALERTPVLVTAAGGLLARVHHAIATWTPRTMRRTVAERLERCPLPDVLDDVDLRRWHESLAATGAPRAVIHGDFYRRNVLECDSRPVALLDWDEAHEDYLAQEIAWSTWEFANVGGVVIDERLASAFLDGYVSAGGRLPPGFRTDAVNFIRWRLRDELHRELTVRAHGDAIDQEYFDTEMTAFTSLRDTDLFPDTFGPSGTAQGRRWLATVPELVSAFCERWNLERTDEGASSGANAVVTPVRRGMDACVLKLTMDADAARAEARALDAWDGNGAVRLLASDPPSGALLLERLSERSLSDLDVFGAAEIAGHLLRRLAIPAPGGFAQQSDLATEIATTLPDRQRRVGDPVAPQRIEAAVRLAAELAEDDTARLVHSDIHYGNVLAAHREPWLVIDPRPVSGDPELAVPELLWSRHDELGGPDELRRLLDVVVRSGELDAERAHAWAIVRCVDYWIWGLEHGLTEDPIRCRRILEALA